MDGPANLTDELLRPALEFALVVAAAGAKNRPPLPSPAALRPLHRFQKLPASALGVVRKAVEDDDVFRQRLGSVVTDDDVGALGRLWLARPEGWEDEAARLATDELAEQERVDADRQERSAVKRLEAAERTAARLRAELVVQGEELAGERARRKSVEAERSDLAQRLTDRDAELAAARAEHRRVTDQLAAARRTLEQTEAIRVELAATVAELETRLDDALAARVTAEAAAGAVAAAVAGGGATASTAAAPRAAPVATAAAAASLREAAVALGQVAKALVDTSCALAGPPDAVVAPAPVPAVAGDTRRDRGPRRQPVSLPGGLYGSQPEVAAHLMRVPGMVVVIDGYNVAKTGWPDIDLAGQRDRLLDLAEDLVRRQGTRIHVVFDGAAVAAPPTGRRLVHVRFSPAGVLADDVIRALVDELPADVPVLVVTADNAVVASVRASGANTVSSAQFLAAVGR